MDANLVSDRISVLVRFHDMGGLSDLDLCLFSLAHQRYHSLEVVICCQNLSEANLAAVRQVAGQHLELYGRTFQLINLDLGEGDHRAALLNAGIAVASGRYLAFLDHDDVVYGDAYQTLISALRRDKTALAATGGIDATHVWGKGRHRYVQGRNPILRDFHKFHIFSDNIYPIHSVVIDRKRVDPALLSFDEGMSRNEDYLFYLRIFSSGHWIDRRKYLTVGEYTHHIDGSNTTLAWSQDIDKHAAWRMADREMRHKRDNLTLHIPLHEFVEFYHAHGHAHPERNTVEAARAILMSRSWRFSRPLRRMFGGKEITPPNSEAEAIGVIYDVMHSASWSLTLPLRILSRMRRRGR